MKNLFLLALLTLVTMAWAKEPIEKESMEDAEGFKVEKAVTETKAERKISGAKAKKEPTGDVSKDDEIVTDEGSEVKYWRYSEE